MATDDRKVQLGVTVDATEARKGFGDVKDSARDMAQSVTEQGTAAGKAIDSIGSGASQSAQKVDAGTRSMIQSIQRQTAATQAAAQATAQGLEQVSAKGSAAYYDLLTVQRGFDPAKISPYTDALRAAEAELAAIKGSLGGVDPAQQKFLQSLQSQSSALKDQIATFGMNKTELLAYQATQMGAGEAAASLISEIARQEEALRSLRDSAATASASVNAFGETGDEASARIKDMVVRSREAQAAMNATAGASDAAASSTAAFGRSSEDVRATVAAQNAAMSATSREMAEVNQAMEALRAGAAQSATSFAALTEQENRLQLVMASGKLSMEEYDALLAALWKDEDRLQSQLNSVTSRYDPLGAATRKLASDEGLLKDAFDHGRLSAEQYDKAIAGIDVDHAAVGLKELAQQEAQVERSFKSGAMSSAQYKAALADIAGSRAMLNAVADGATSGARAMDGLGSHTKAARTEILRLVNDVANGNFGRFEQAATVLAEQFDLLGALTGPVALGMAGVGAAVGVFAVAAYQGYEESEKLKNSLALTGNAAGLTATSFSVMARAVADDSGKGIGSARDALQALVSTGQFAGQQLQLAAEDVLKFSELSGESVDKVAADYAKMADGVTKWAVEHNKQLGYMTQADYERISALEKAGDTEGALLENLNVLHAHFADVADEKLGYVQAAWKATRQEISDTWDALKGIGREQTTHEKLLAASGRSYSASTEYLGGTDTESGGANDPEALAMQEEKEGLAAAAKSVDEANNKAAIAAEERLHTQQLSLDKAAKAADERNKAYNDFVAAWNGGKGANADALKGVTVTTGADGKLSFSGGQYDSMMADIAKRAAGNSGNKAAKAADAQEAAYSSQATAIQADIAAQEKLIAAQDQYGASQAKVSEQDKRVLQIEQQLGLAQKDRTGKLNDAQLQSLLTMAKQDAALAHQSQAMAAYNAQLEAWKEAEDKARDALSDDLALYGTTGEARKLATIQLQAEAEARAKIAAAAKAGNAMSADEQESLMAEANLHAAVAKSIQGQRDALASATDLEKQHDQFQANSIADSRQRADALTAIEAKKWQDQIDLTEAGTEAQKKLIGAYEQWLVDQSVAQQVTQWKSLIDGIGTDFHNGFLQMLSDGEAGWKSFTKSLVNTFEVTVVNALYEAFAKKWVIQVVAEIAGVTQGDAVKNALLGTSNTDGTSVSQLLSSGGSLKSLYDWAAAKSAIGDATNGVSSVTGSSLGYNVGSASSYYSGGGDSYNFGGTGLGYNSTGSSNLFGTGISGSDALGALGSAAAGYGIGSAIGGTGAKVGGSVGALAGSFAIPIPVLGTVIGGVVGSVLGKVVGGLFGGGETRYGGVYSTADGTAANTSKVGAGPSGGMNATESGTTVGNVDLTYNTIKTLAGALGGSLEGLGTYHAGWELSPSKGNSWVEAGFVQDLGDTSDRTSLSGVKDADTVATDFTLELQRSIVKSLQKANLDKPYADYLAQFDASTLTADDVTNIENELQTMKAFFDTVKALGPSFGNLKNAGTSAQYAIANLAGGMDTLSSELSYYSQNFTTTQEQYATQAANVQAQLDALGEGSVTTKDQFKAVVESLDLTTDAGQSLYQSMLALAPAFEQMIENETAATAAAQQAADAQQALWDNYYGAVYTSSQQAAVAQGQLKAKFDALGVSMPSTNAEFEALVENMDTSTQPMKDLQNALLALAPAFAQMTSAVQQAEPVLGAVQKAAISTLSSSAQSLYTDKSNASSLLDSINSSLTGNDADTSAQISSLWSEMTGGGVSLTQQIDLATQLNDLITKRYQAETQSVSALTDQVKQIRDYVQSLKAGDLSTETPSEKLADAAQLYADTLAKAQGGDQTAIGNLSTTADSYLKLAQTYYASSDSYTQIFASVTSQLSAFGDALDSQSQSSDQLSQQSLDQLTQLRDIVSGQVSSASSQYEGVMGQLAQQLSTLDAIEQAAGIQSEVPSILQGLPSEIAAELASIIGTGAATGGDQITSLYQSMLGRTPTANEVSYWTDSFANGSKTLSDFKYSADQELINNAYQQILGRAADSGGLQFYTDKLYSGSESLDQIKSDLQQSLINGSHAGGADNIPFDGYVAELHKGEAVVTSANNAKLSKMLAIDWSQYGTGNAAAMASGFKALTDRIGQLEAALVQATQQNAAVVADATTRSAQTISDGAQKAAEINQRTASAKPTLV